MIEFNQIGIETKAKIAVHIFGRKFQEGWSTTQKSIEEKFGIHISETHLANIRWGNVKWAEPFHNLFFLDQLIEKETRNLKYYSEIAELRAINELKVVYSKKRISAYKELERLEKIKMEKPNLNNIENLSIEEILSI